METTENIIISHEETNETDSTSDLRKTKRQLHFSDGTMNEPWEDFADDEEQQADTLDRVASHEEEETKQGLKNRMKSLGIRVMTGIDYIGEGLASFLGITTPKYISKSYAESVYNKSAGDQHKSEDSLEEVNWSTSDNARVITVAPQSSIQTIP